VCGNRDRERLVPATSAPMVGRSTSPSTSDAPMAPSTTVPEREPGVSALSLSPVRRRHSAAAAISWRDKWAPACKVLASEPRGRVDRSPRSASRGVRADQPALDGDYRAPAVRRDWCSLARGSLRRQGCRPHGDDRHRLSRTTAATCHVQATTAAHHDRPPPFPDGGVVLKPRRSIRRPGSGRATRAGPASRSA